MTAHVPEISPRGHQNRLRINKISSQEGACCMLYVCRPPTSAHECARYFVSSVSLFALENPRIPLLYHDTIDINI